MRFLALGAKRLADILVSAAALTILAPLLLGLILVIELNSPGSAFFIQRRVGKDGRPFPCLKFRTMVVGADRRGRGFEVDRDDARITSLGEWLRRWSLDELPQLLNVLAGHMSIVGPRPTLEYQVAQYTPAQRRRLLMKPGLTGWAQVNGRNSIPWSRRIALDCWYVDHWSLWMDAVICRRTVGVICSPEQVYAGSGADVWDAGGANRGSPPQGAGPGAGE